MPTPFSWTDPSTWPFLPGGVSWDQARSANEPLRQVIGPILFDSSGELRGNTNLSPARLMFHIPGVGPAVRDMLGGTPPPPPRAAPSDVNGWDFNGGTPTVNPTNGPAASIFGPESAGNVNARNPRSSAAGLGQFLHSTWMDPDLRRRAGFANVPDSQWEAMRSGPNSVAANIAMTNAYAERNTEQWQQRFGTQPNPGQVYGMHFLNGDGFIRLTDEVQRNPNADATQMFPSAAAANPTIFYQGQGSNRRPRTAQEVYGEITRRGGGAGGEGASNPFVAQSPTLLDPRAANLIPLPDARNYAPVSFGTPPTRPDVPARPQAEQIDIPALTAQFDRYAPHAPDVQRQHRLEFNDILAGMASGALSVDPITRGVGGMLLGAGAGAATARARAERMNDAEQTAWEESMRQFGLDVTRVRVNAEESNRGTRNANANLTWQDAYDATERAFNDSRDQWSNNLAQLQFNTGRRDTFAQRTEAAQAARGQARLGIYETNIQSMNQFNQLQGNLDLQRFAYDERHQNEGMDGTALARGALGLATSVGILPNDRAPISQNAIQGAAALTARNAPGAVNAFAQELVLSNHVVDVVTEIARGFTSTGRTVPPELAAIQQELTAINDPRSQQAGQSSAEQAANREARLNNVASRLAALFNQSPEGTLRVAEAYARQGLPMATLLTRSLRPHHEAQTAAPQTGGPLAGSVP